MSFNIFNWKLLYTFNRLFLISHQLIIYINLDLFLFLFIFFSFNLNLTSTFIHSFNLFEISHFFQFEIIIYWLLLFLHNKWTRRLSNIILQLTNGLLIPYRISILLLIMKSTNTIKRWLHIKYLLIISQQHTNRLNLLQTWFIWMILTFNLLVHQIFEQLLLFN